MVFTEYKHSYFGKTLSFECTLARKEKRHVVIVFEIHQAMNFMGSTFLPGSKSFGYFWSEKNYNVYHWLDPNGKTMLFYFNISENTIISTDRVEWDDLIVDVVLFPNFRAIVLDEEEVPATISKRHRNIIEKTKDEILSSAKTLIKYFETETQSLRSDLSRKK